MGKKKNGGGKTKCKDDISKKNGAKQEKENLETSHLAKRSTCSMHNLSEQQAADLRKSLLSWYTKNARDLPWRTVAKEEKDDNIRGYSVLVSEIMLQQTQVATVIDYFRKWMQKWPTTAHLAKATLEEINQAWAGLGYYSRGRRLWEGAQRVEIELSGKMPQTRKDLLNLPGVGRYTASAVASIAYGQSVGLVDGNVIRVLTRLLAVGADSASQVVTEWIWDLVDRIVDKENAGDFNQSLMELGATVCTPKSPSCSNCPVKSFCQAYKMTKQDDIPDIEDCNLCLRGGFDRSLGVANFPQKAKKTASRSETTLMLLLKETESSADGERLITERIAVKQRPSSGLLANLFELITVPTDCTQKFGGKNLQMKKEEDDIKEKTDSNPKQLTEQEEVSLIQDWIKTNALPNLDSKEDAVKSNLPQVRDLKRSCEVVHIFSHINMTYVVYTAELLDASLPKEVKWMTQQEFLSSGTSTAMKKVMSAVAANKSNAATRGNKRKGTPQTAPDPKQRSISSFFTPKVKAEK